MRKIKHIMMALLVILGGVTAAVSSSEIAGAQSILPCPGGWNGWFDSYDTQTNAYSVVNCTIQGNHIVVDSWVGNSYSQGVLDIWYDPSATVEFTNGSCAGSHCWPFYANFRRAGNPVAWDMGTTFAEVPVLTNNGGCSQYSYEERRTAVSATWQYQLGISTQNCSVNPTYYEYAGTGAFAGHRPWGTNGGHRTMSAWEMIFNQGSWYVPQYNLSRVGVAWG